MSSASQRLTAVAVAILSVLIVAVLVLQLTGGSRATGAGPSPSESARPTQPSSSGNASASVEPSASGAQDAQAVFSRIQQQVEQIRELPPAGIGPAEIIGRAQLEKELADQFAEDYPKEQQDADNVTLRALGLLKPDQDVAKLQLQLLQGQVIGFYDDKTRRMVVVSEAGVNGEAKITYAHEYTHALQDHSFGLAKLGLDDEQAEDDQAMARLALVEGDATYTMLLWATTGGLTQQELQGIVATPQPDITGIPGWMVQQLTFSYTAGMNFVSALYQRDNSFTDVDAAFRSKPPVSTEQVIHPDKYFANEGPMQVARPDPAAALGAGWKNVESTSLGEAMIGITLQSWGAGGAGATAAFGWGGDQLTAASGPNGAFAVAWRLKWDSAQDATEFASAYASVHGSLPVAARLVQVSGTEQLVLQASSAELVSRLAAGAGA
jgi:hypothetical protein